jgi:hypothetical protein
MPEGRCCPNCSYTDRILVMKTRGPGYRLSCSWCAYLSEPVGAHEAFFRMWGAPYSEVGAMIDLDGAPHWYKGRYVESVPVRVINNGVSALVVERKDEA